MDSLKKSCQILNPFLNVFAPVMLTSLKQNCKVSSQHQNPRRFCFVEMNIEKKKFYLRYCARRPKILSTNLTDQVTRYASSQFPKGLHDDKSKKIPNMQKGKNRKRGKPTKKTSQEDSGKKMARRKRESPNYFLAIQITEDEIKQNVREIQEIILAKEENLSTAMIGIDTLHLTLGVYYLEDGFSIIQIKRALDKFHSQLKAADFVPPCLKVSTLGHFNHKVLYASLEENQGLEELNTLVNGVRTSLENDGVYTADDRYTPHVTISKMSKDMYRLRKLGVSRIDPSHYQEKRTAYLGQQVVKSIQLCAMNVPKTESGYYYVEHEIMFS